MKVNEVDFNPQFVSRMIPKLEWNALVQAAEEVNLSPDCQTHVRQSGTVRVFHSSLLTVSHLTSYKLRNAIFDTPLSHILFDTCLDPPC